MSGFKKQIIEWYEENRRILPWRETQDPYKIWISEIILQQTRVNQGLAYYLHFLEIFPDIHTLAGASEEEVLKVWQGLGYYSRARNMHQAAKRIVSEQNGVFPATYEELIELKGIGEYTASAVASIAFGLTHAVIDGNVLRFISRLRGIHEPVNTIKGKEIIKQIMQSEIDETMPGTFNQAVMEFGALVCKPRKPACNVCMFQTICVARNTGNVDQIPVKEKKPGPKPRYFHYIIIILKEDKQVFTFLKKRSDNDIWRNLYEFPVVEGDRLLKWDEIRMKKEFLSIFEEKKPDFTGLVKDIKHVLSHRILHARCFVVHTEQINDRFIKVSLENIRDYPVSRLMEKILDELNITFHI
jgi:A/G-specific adenine glycosylase